MYRWFLSLRYLRTRKTNWIGVAGIFVAVAALILILSIMSGFLRESKDHLRGNLADVIVAPRMDHPLASGELPPGDPTAALELVRAHPKIEAACAQLTWVGMLLPEGRSQVPQNPIYGDIALVNLVGIDVEDEFQTSDLRSNLLPPDDDDPWHHYDPVANVDDPFAPPPGYEPDGAPKPAVILGAQLASAWRLFKGDEVEIYSANIDPVTGQVSETPLNRTFVVAGTFRTGENEMDLERVYMERKELGDFLARRAPWSQIMCRLSDYERDKAEVVADLRRDLAEAGVLHHPTERISRFEVQTWEDFRGNLLGAIENEKTLMGIMLSLVMMVAGFTVFAILTMLVAEKRRDIGILAALGATPNGILVLFLLIGCWEAVFGASLGLAAGIWAALRIDAIERWLTNLTGWQIFDRSVYLFDHIPSEVEVAGVAWIVGGSVLATLVAAALPAWRAARLDPIDALRYE